MAWRKATGVLAGAAVGVLLLASPAFASTQNLTLNPAHKNQTAAGFGGGDECDAPFTEDMNVDGWHFVWQKGGDFATVDLTFNNGTSDVHVIVSGAAGVVNTGTGWTAFFGDTGGPNPKVKHLYVFTQVGWTLKDGVGTGTDGTGTVFNLSHTCAGTPGEECTGDTCQPPCETDCVPPPCVDGCEPPCEESDDCSTTPPTESGTPSPSTSVNEETLPTTGSSLTGVIVVGTALVGAGIGTLLFLRRRRDTTAS
jgi:LPXTG-motif cell wall-anchored protein